MLKGIPVNYGVEEECVLVIIMESTNLSVC